MTPSKQRHHLRILSQTQNLEVIRNFVANLARQAGFPEEDIGKIELAVDEACTNVIEHAYEHAEDQEIGITVEIDQEKLTVVITDWGKGFSPDKVVLPDMRQYLAELRVGGLGIYLMKSLMDEVQYARRPNGKNEVKLVKYFLNK